MKRRMTIISAVAALFVGTGSAAAAGFFAWSDHAAPLDFEFGNEIDGHQQSQLRRNGELAGFLYVRFTGVTTADGYRVASHVDCNAMPGCTPAFSTAHRGSPMPHFSFTTWMTIPCS